MRHPKTSQPPVPETIHILQAVSTAKAVRLQLILMKSILTTYNGNQDIQFHWIADPSTQLILEAVMQSWRPRKVKYSIYWDEKLMVSPSILYLHE